MQHSGNVKCNDEIQAALVEWRKCGKNLLIYNGVKAQDKRSVGCPNRMGLMFGVNVMQDIYYHGSSIKSNNEAQVVHVDWR